MFLKGTLMQFMSKITNCISYVDMILQHYLISSTQISPFYVLNPG